MFVFLKILEGAVRVRTPGTHPPVTALTYNVYIYFNYLYILRQTAFNRIIYLQGLTITNDAIAKGKTEYLND